MPHPHDVNFTSLAFLMAAGQRVVDSKPFGGGREAEKINNDTTPCIYYSRQQKCIRLYRYA